MDTRTAQREQRPWSSLLCFSAKGFCSQVRLVLEWCGEEALTGKDPGRTLLQAERGGHREEPGLLKWMLSGSKECSEGKKSQILLYLKLVTSANRVHDCALTVGVLTGVAMVVEVCSHQRFPRAQHTEDCKCPGSDPGSCVCAHQELWNGGLEC